MAQEMRTYNHWKFKHDENRYGWLTIDVAESSANVLTHEVLEELRALLEWLRDNPVEALFITSGKKKGFIAGADINGFTTLQNQEQALELIRQGQDIFTELEQLPFPTTALIHGFCLGGGLELALACDFRIATDDPATRIGLPEVKLGIHPGFGGTVRLIRLIGAPAALPLMLSGHTLTGKQAAKKGIVTYAVPRRLLHSAALQVVEERPQKKRPMIARLTNAPMIRPLIGMMARKDVAKRVQQEQYPAPYALIDLWQQHGGSWKKMMEQEARSVAELIRTPTAQNLIRVFKLPEKLKSLPADPTFSPKHVHVIGAGVMGGDIAAWCAFKGMQVSIQDNNHDILARAVQRATLLFERKLKAPHLVKAALDRFMPDLDGVALPKADVVIEAIFEDVGAKKQLLQSVEPRLKQGAVLASNTSSIPLENLAQGLARPEKLIGLHFFNPVAKMLLVEVVHTPLSDEQVTRKGTGFTKKIGKLPLPVTSSPGFLVNRILMPYLHEAALLEAEGVPAVAIDHALINFGMPVGPIELIDMVGLDIAQSVAEFMSDDPELKMPDSLQQHLNQGRKGKKSGAGYYEYKDNKAVKPKLGDSSGLPGDLCDRIILRLVNESVACLREQVVADEDLLDAGMIFGTGFAPFRGGVMQYVHQNSAATLHARLQTLAAQYGSRFTPDQGWTQLQ